MHLLLTNFVTLAIIFLTSPLLASVPIEVKLYRCHTFTTDDAGMVLENWNEQFEIFERTVTDNKSGTTDKKTYIRGSNSWYGMIEVQFELKKNGFESFFNDEKDVSISIAGKAFEKPLSTNSHYFGRESMYYARLDEPLTGRYVGCFRK